MVTAKHLSPWALAGILFGWAGQALAGPLFFSGRYDDAKGVYLPGADDKGPCFTVLFSTTRAEIDDGQARIMVEETIAGPQEGHTDALGLLPLPPGTRESDVAITIDGKDGPQLEAQYLTADQARKVYRVIAEATKEARLLSLANRPALMLPVVRLQRRTQVVIELGQALATKEGLRIFTSPMPAASLSRRPVERVTLDVALTSSRPLRSIFSPTHEATIERQGVREARVRVSVEGVTSSDDFRLYLVADDDALGLRVLTHRIEGEDSGYFMVLGNPTGSPGEEGRMDKDMVLVLDTSGSMRGEKMEQARSAMEYCLKHLGEGDRFNVITFGTEVTSFNREGLVPTTEAQSKAALEFIEDSEPLGRTNIADALSKGLAGAPDPNRPRMMIFLTDGTPTAGELDPKNILKRLSKMNTSKTRIFVLGVGHDVNTHLLDGLAEETEGNSEYLDADEEIDVKMAALFDRLNHPLLTQVQISFSGLKTAHVFPDKLPALFRGSELLILGRYQGGGRYDVILSGSRGAMSAEHAVTVDFPTEPAPDNEFVASLWASRRIGQLLQQIRLHGENTELIQEVVRLSHQFGIITEYTEFLSQSDQQMTPEEAAQEATRRMKEANAHEAGIWAVQQANNERALQQKTVAAPASNIFRDRQGRTRAADKVMQVGRRAFYKKDGRWVDSQADKAKRVRRVKQFSDEYYDLVDTNKDFSKAQSLDDKMTITVGEESIEVY